MVAGPAFVRTSPGGAGWATAKHPGHPPRQDHVGQYRAPHQGRDRVAGAELPFHPLHLDDCLSKIQRPKIDEHEDSYLFIVLHFPVFNRMAQGHRGQRGGHLHRGRLLRHPPRRGPQAAPEDVPGVPDGSGAPAPGADGQEHRLPAVSRDRSTGRLLLPDPQQDRRQPRGGGGHDLRGGRAADRPGLSR